MRQMCLDMVYELAKEDPRIFFIGSDLGANTLDKFKEDMPSRFIMEGISEANVVGMASGLAMEGKIVYVNTIATFITRRCYEQVVLDASLHNVNVRLIGNGGGLVYAPLGPTHMATDDIAIMRALPNMTVVAPAPKALTASPEWRIPPSAMTGTPCRLAACAHSAIAEIIGMPMPAMTRVVQIEPEPIPTFTPSTPSPIRASAPSAVATLPAMRSTLGKRPRSRCTIVMTPCECPWAVSTTSTSAPAATSASARSTVSLAIPTAPPTRRRPSSSLDAFG